MTSTTSAYLAVSQNLPRYQAMTAAEPAVKTATAYYEANIGSVTSIQDFVGNYRLLSYALDAYGLGDQINATALITKVLEGGVSNPNSLANTLSNSAWKAFATAFNFVGDDASSAASPNAVQTTTSDYVEQQLESDQGAQNVGVELALYFQRVAPTVTSEYGILADPNLLEVAQTIFGLAGDQRREHQYPSADALPADADLRSAGSSEAQAAHRAVHRDVRPDLRTGIRRDHEFDRRLEQLEFRPVGRRCCSCRRDQLERLCVGQRTQRLHRRADASLFDRPVVEPAEVFARRLNALRIHGGPSIGERPAQAPRPNPRHALDTVSARPSPLRAT